MDVRSTCWSITINNPVESDEEAINVARQKGWSIQGQLERGAEGTPHYQLMLKTPQVRMSAVKKVFRRAHIEVARNAAALSQYVHKEDTREGELREQQEMYPTLDKFWDLIVGHLMRAWWAYECWTIECDVPEEHRWYSLAEFDKIVNWIIQDGFHVETMAVNPQTRSAWRLFGRSIVIRSIRRQRDRQTTENAVAVVNIPTDAVSSSSGTEGRQEAQGSSSLQAYVTDE